MKITKTKKHTWIVIGASSIILLAILLIGLEALHITHFIKPDSSPQTTNQTESQKQQEKQAAASQKEQHLDNATKGQAESQTVAPPTDTSTIILTATTSKDTVTVHNELHDQGYSSGSCVLTVTNGNKTTTQKADIMYQPEYSMCAGFSIPISTVGTGNWNINLDVTPYNGQTLHKTITIQVQ